MKKSISTLQDALIDQLQGLYNGEIRVRDEMNNCAREITSPDLKALIKEYTANSDDKLQKLDRIFNYLMKEPTGGKSEVINDMIAETHRLLASASSPHLKDILMIACLQTINAYKASTYRTAYLFAVELELDTAEDLIQQILEWELATGKSLSTLSVHEFNKLNNS